VYLVDVTTLDLAAGELLGVFDDVLEGMTVIGTARQRPGMQHELAARGAGVGGDDRDLDAELVRRRGLALADALGLGAWKEYSFQPRWRWLLIWLARVSGRANTASRLCWPSILRPMSRIRQPKRVRKMRFPGDGG
jgi:hypothetical protein